MKYVHIWNFFKVRTFKGDILWLMKHLIMFNVWFWSTLNLTSQENTCHVTASVTLNVEESYYSNVIWVLWYLKSLASRLFYTPFRHITKKPIKLCINGHLRGEIPCWLADSSHKWPVMQKAFPCHDVIKCLTYISSASSASSVESTTMVAHPHELTDCMPKPAGPCLLTRTTVNREPIFNSSNH